MSTSLRIEELKKKFDENPRRYFAPLANEYRKAGDLQQAISICQAHLPQQPGHMSGHIVYGQALFEARQFDQARTVFETALALDPENLIALRYLGDIAFELGDRGGARGWYTRVLETDPRNEEIAALMAAMGEERAGASRDGAPPPGGPAASAPPAAPPAPQVPAPMASTRPAETPRPAVAAPEPPRAPTKPDVVRPAETRETQATPATSSTDAELEKLFSRPAQPKDQKPPPSLGERKSPAEEVASPSRAPAHEVKTPDTGFVTETMAELYLKQGFQGRALDVYRQLVTQNPGDAGLRGRMEKVERDMRGGAGAPGASLGDGGALTRGGTRSGAGSARSGPTVRQFLVAIGTRGVSGRGRGVAPPPGSGPRTSGEIRVPQERSARSASGGSIDALFAGAPPSRDDAAAASTLADAFPSAGSGTTDAQIAGRPAHPAATELSLDHVFRDGGGAGAGRGGAGVSFDQFFSQPTSGGAPSPTEASGPTPPSGGADDIEQFNAWLQGLKKR